MERNVTNLLTLGNRIHVVCEDYETGKIFMQDAYAEGFRWKDGSHPNSITYCRIHHNRLLSSYGSFGGAMAWHHNQEAYFVSYKLWKEGAERFLKRSPNPDDTRIYIPVEEKQLPDRRSHFEQSIFTTAGEAAFEKLQFDGREYLLPLLKTEEGGFAWREMMSIHRTYNREFLEKFLELYCGDKARKVLSEHP